MMNANDRQIGGSHYQKGTMQHWDFAVQCQENRYLESQITRYLSRWRDKNGMEDLEKAVHYTDKLIEEVLVGHIRHRHVAISASDPRIKLFVETYNLTIQEEGIIVQLVNWTTIKHLYLAKENLIAFIGSLLK